MTALLQNIVLSVCSDFPDAEIALRELAQDASANHVKEIVDKLTANVATIYNILQGGVYCGYIITEKYGNEFVILAMRSYQNLSVFDTILPTLEMLARQSKANQLVFHTVRPGLIRQALASKFTLSSVILRKFI